MKTQFKKILATLALMLVVGGGSPLLASEIDDQNTIERVGVFVRDLKICHQQEWRVLTVDLEYEAEAGSPAMEIQKVKDHIRAFLEGYSNPDDFWEIMNTKLVHSLSEAFPEISAMESTLSLGADQVLINPRHTTVAYDKDSPALKESFGFTKLNYQICQETFQALDFQIHWEVHENPGQWDYPDYLWIDEAMDQFFAEHPMNYSKWDMLKPMLETYLLDTFSTLTSIDIEVTVAQ